MGKKVKDLVCGMEFDRDTASGTFEFNGKIYYFCSTGCRDHFEKNPEKFKANEEKDQS